MSDQQCVATVRKPGGNHRCHAYGKIERDGVRYCKIHDPERTRRPSANTTKRVADIKIQNARAAKDAAVQAVIDATRQYQNLWTRNTKTNLINANANLLVADQTLTAAIKEREELS